MPSGAPAHHSVIAESSAAKSSAGPKARLGGGGGGEDASEACSGGQADAVSGGGEWLSCLRRLYAAVPPEWLSTVELVLEQTLHQMPDVAESLLSAVQQTVVGGSTRTCGGGGDDMLGPERPDDSPPSSSGFKGMAASIGHDLGLLLLLLREASPLRACSLPLLPDGMDRGRRAESGVRDFLLVAARHGSVHGGGTDNGGAHSLRNRAGSLTGARALLRGMLCSEMGSITGRGAGTTWNHGVGGGCASGGGGGSSGGGENSGVASERGSQLLELALRWLEDGEGENCGVNDSGGGAEIAVEELASEMISAVFDAIAGARPQVLRALLSGVFDQSQGGTACAGSYLRAWEALMAQEARQQVNKMASLFFLFAGRVWALC